MQLTKVLLQVGLDVGTIGYKSLSVYVSTDEQSQAKVPIFINKIKPSCSPGLDIIKPPNCSNTPYTFVFQSAAVPGERFSNPMPAQSRTVRGYNLQHNNYQQAKALTDIFVKKYKMRTTLIILTLILFFSEYSVGRSTVFKSSFSDTSQHKTMDMTIKILILNLKPGSRDKFHDVYVTQSLPLLRKWEINVGAHGASLHDENTYFVIRSFKNLGYRQKSEDAFYGSDDWKNGPRTAILSFIESLATLVIPTETLKDWMDLIK